MRIVICAAATTALSREQNSRWAELNETYYSHAIKIRLPLTQAHAHTRTHTHSQSDQPRFDPPHIHRKPQRWIIWKINLHWMGTYVKPFKIRYVFLTHFCRVQMIFGCWCGHMHHAPAWFASPTDTRCKCEQEIPHAHLSQHLSKDSMPSKDFGCFFIIRHYF